MVDDATTPIARSRDEIAILFETIQDLASTLSTREVLERLLQRTLRHLDSEIGSILLLGPDRRLRIAHAQGLPGHVVEGATVALGEGISGHVAMSGEALLIDNVETHPQFARRNNERYYTRSAISAPLRFRGRVLGVINVNNRRDHDPYTPDDLRLVEALAAHAAMALSNARKYEEALERAQRDALTGLANHGHFFQVLEMEVQRARRHAHPLALVMLDGDRFKALNDAHGHQAGDAVLAGIARVLTAKSRVSDLPARYGGEEFAVILPATPRAGAATFAEKIRSAVEEEAFGSLPAGAVTVSAGVAALPDDAVEAAALVEAADRRLYAAKAAGRNRVIAEG